MALITMRQLLDHAAENDYALPAFNVNNLEYIQAVMRAADATDSPVILQASRGARAGTGALRPGKRGGGGGGRVLRGGLLRLGLFLGLHAGAEARHDRALGAG